MPTNSPLLPETYIWDTDPEELVARLHQNVNEIAIAVNAKDFGLYSQQEIVNGQTYFPNPANTAITSVTKERSVYRKVINFGTLPNTGTKSVPHNIPISDTYSFTRIYATASDPVGLTYMPIQYINVDLTNVNITTTADLTNYTITYVVLEYINT